MSDIRKIQTGNNQYTLHARVSDKLAVSSQIGSPTKPVYVDSSGQVKACSQEIPTGMTIDSVLNDTSVNAVQNKVINAALKGKNPKAKADFIASSDLTALPITAGVLDLNGYTLTLSGTTELTGTLTIKNGTIGGNGTLQSFKEDDENSIYNFIYINDCKLINQMKLNLQSYIAILNNIHGTVVTLDGDEYKYANLEFLFFGYITNFSNISIKNTNLELINSSIQTLVLTNGCWMKIENTNVLIRSSLEINFYGTINAKMFSCSSIHLNEYERPSHNPDQKSTFELYSCSAPGKSDERYFNHGYKYYDIELKDWIEVDSFDELVNYYYIETVCRYNGTVSSYSALPDIDKYSKYDIYTITNADATHNIKAGDSVICDGEKWVNLSGTVDLSNYVKKDDISAVYKYKGTKTNYSELPTSGNNIGDVWNITKADKNNHIKAGDNVAWDGSQWDNLSGTVKLSDYLKKGGSQTTTSTVDSGSNVYTFTDGSTITVKNGSKGSTGAAATWFSGGAVTGTSTTAKTFTVSGSKAGDMYLNTGTSNVYKATAANQWVYLCNIKGPQGTPGNNGTTPTIKAAAGGNIGTVGTPSVTANTSGTTTTFTFNNLKGQKGDTGATVTWHTGTAVTGTAATVAGAKTGDMYLNTKTYNVYKSTGTNKWAGVCNIKGANGTTPIIKAAAGGNINSVGTPTVSATTSGATTTFTFNNLKGQKGETGATITWHTGTAVPNAGVHAVTNAKVGDMYLNTRTCDVFKAANAVQESFNWVLVCNIKGAKGDAADIPKLAKGVAGIVPGTTDDNLNAARWLNGGKNGTGTWSPLPIAGGGTSGLARTCKDYTSNAANPAGYGHGSTPPTIQPLTSGANDYRGVECDKQGMLFVNVPAYEKNINRAQNTVLAAPTTGTGTATFRKLTTSDIPWGDKLKVVTESQFNSTAPRAGVFYFVLEE